LLLLLLLWAQLEKKSGFSADVAIPGTSQFQYWTDQYAKNTDSNWTDWQLLVIVHACLWVDMFFTASQATHTGKWRFFLNGWKEEDPDCKFTSLNLGFMEKSAWKGRWEGKKRLGKFFDGVLPSTLHRSNIHKIYTSCGALSTGSTTYSPTTRSLSLGVYH
jgi:hypothetical protein